MTYYILLDQLFNIQPTTKQVDQWTKARRLEDIEYFLENGDYKVRIACAKALVVLDEKSSIERLRNQLSDKVKPVAQECANSLRKLSASSEVEREIEEMEVRWKEREAIWEENSKGHKDVFIANWEKTDWLAIVKQQLKKRMR